MCKIKYQYQYMQKIEKLNYSKYLVRMAMDTMDRDIVQILLLLYGNKKKTMIMEKDK